MKFKLDLRLLVQVKATKEKKELASEFEWMPENCPA